VRIGVADSGVAFGHEEFNGRVLGGGDWHGTEQGLLDENGHGTHVASLDAIQRNIPVAIMGAPTSQSEMRLVLEAGASGYVPKNIWIKAFFSAISLMAEGEVFLLAEVSTHHGENSFLPNNWLTGREQDMLAGLLAGKSNKEIAQIHCLSEVTVKHHLKRLRGKLGARNRTHAVCRAIELGIVPEAP
jgi:DNA-binding NarL/FixJ family response regulator